MTTTATGPAAPGTSVYQPGKLIPLMIYGAVGWFLAALLCRTLGSMGVYDGSAQIILYAAIIPGTIPVVWLMKPLLGVRRSEMFAAAAIVDMSALVLDGIAVAWFPSLYGTDPQMVANSAAAVLYGAGVLLAIGFVMNGPDKD